MSVKIQQNGLNFSCQGIDHFTIRASDILERIHRFPLGLECRCRFVSREIWRFPFFCLKYTTLEAQLCQIQYSGQMRWSRILFEANINKSLGAQGNVPLGHPHRGEIKSFNPNKGYGFVISARFRTRKPHSRWIFFGGDRVLVIGFCG